MSDEKIREFASTKGLKESIKSLKDLLLEQLT
jgi:hypothetical protein